MVILAWVAFAITVGANWWSRLRADDRLEQISKPLATVSIGVLAASVWDGSSRPALISALIAFVLCLVGDVALLDRFDMFVTGLAAFLLGHLAFMAMFAAVGFSSARLAGLAMVLMAGLTATIGLRIVAGARRQSEALRAPVLAYLAVIAAMAVSGWATGRLTAVVGSTLFIISDSILGIRRFLKPAPWMSVATMVTYHLALIGLALTLR